MDINNKRLEETIKILDDFFGQQSSSLALVPHPSSIKYGTDKWLYYIFYSCLLDYGMRSKIYHENLINTYEKYPDIFNPRYVVNNKEILGPIIKDNIHPRYPNVALNKWIKLSSKLSEYDNLLDKVKACNSFEELNNFVKSIGGYGQKTGGLLLRLIYEANICNFKDNMTTIPLDRHDIEISYLNGIIEQKTLNEKQIKVLSDSFIKCGNKLNIDPGSIDKYLWEVGNNFCNKKECLNCPLYKNCITKITNK